MERARGRVREQVSRGRHRSRTRWKAQSRGVFRSRKFRHQSGQPTSNRKEFQLQRKHGGFDWRVYNQTTAYYFTNCSEDWSYEQMWKTFLKFGRVYDIYSLLRKNRTGSKFGFVRFLNVYDSADLEKRLNQIRIGNYSLRVNRPKFEEPGVARGQKRLAHNNNHGLTNERSHKPWGPSTDVKPGKSYADAVRSKPIHGTTAKRDPTKKYHSKPAIGRGEWRVKKNLQDWSGLEFTTKEEDSAWLKGCMVGTVHAIEIIPTLQEKFFMEGYFSCKVRAMGGKLVLLEGEDKDELKDLVELAPEWLGQWF
ncbi:hypothetical protein SLA2020_101180 [Shorea laevis]